MIRPEKNRAGNSRASCPATHHDGQQCTEQQGHTGMHACVTQGSMTAWATGRRTITTISEDR